MTCCPILGCSRARRAESAPLDILSIVGLVLAAVRVLLGAVLNGAGLMALVSTEAFMIVGVGTIAATCVQTPLPVMKHALKIFPWIIKPPPRTARAAHHQDRRLEQHRAQAGAARA